MCSTANVIVLTTESKKWHGVSTSADRFGVPANMSMPYLAAKIWIEIAIVCARNSILFESIFIRFVLFLAVFCIVNFNRKTDVEKV